MIHSLKEHLNIRLQGELPGKDAHLEMAPYRKVDYSEVDLRQAKKSAVLILFYSRNEKIYMALTQRNIYKGKHSGQISLPGGKYEDGDQHIFNTALRETQEEIGINSNDIDTIGQMTNVFIPVSNFYVTPVIGFIDYIPQFDIDPVEVKEVIELNVNRLASVNGFETSQVKVSEGLQMKVPSFVFDGKVIWGATALILNELRHLLSDWRV